MPLIPAFDLSNTAAVRTEEASRVLSHTRPDGHPYHTVFEESGNYNLQTGAASPEACMDELAGASRKYSLR